jgi:hypothetical protein
MSAPASQAVAGVKDMTWLDSGGPFHLVISMKKRTEGEPMPIRRAKALAHVLDNMTLYIRPGEKTAEYIDKVLTRITLGGAIYVSAICVLPTILSKEFHVNFYFGGTSLLIVVGVAMDTVNQIESQLIMRHYDGFLKRGRIRGRRG